ncbi:hypothetical protein GPL15_19885 [Clostridium sp. MCC353]|uniref:hypothetical protein n=1 Tax=Clostridium sp. MCC353 TaxID=2592646 RepID=UPI001C0111CC|nr:hypothetical protein [Clostridium sp. MCC353]MBT9778743.1 hypothetical protein [Clostridium sp. MCC353]
MGLRHFTKSFDNSGIGAVILVIRYFFENTGDEETNARNRSLFSGLNIMGAGEEYLSGMTGYPVISFTLKGAKQPDFYLAMVSIKRQIANEFRRHEEIAGKLGDRKERFMKIMLEQGDTDTMSRELSLNLQETISFMIMQKVFIMAL